MTEDDRTEEVLVALSHPIRRKILEFLAEEKEVGAARLLEELNLKSGPLYYHLRKIKYLVQQDEKRKYSLTDKGKEALKYTYGMTSTKNQEIFLEEKIKYLEIGKLRLTPLLNYFAKNPVRTLIEFLIVFLVCGFFSSQASTLIVGNFIVFTPNQIWESYISLFVTWILIVGLAEILARLFYGQYSNTLKFISISSLNYLPQLLTVTIFWIISLSSSVVISIPGIVIYIIFGITQIWSFLVLATALGIAKNLSLEKSVIISLLANYIQILMVIFVVL